MFHGVVQKITLAQFFFLRRLPPASVVRNIARRKGKDKKINYIDVIVSHSADVQAYNHL